MPDLWRLAAHNGPEFAKGRGGGRGAVDRAIAALAATQHGVASLTQLIAIGLDQRAVRHRVAAGRLSPLHRGVYAVGRPDVPLRGRWLAAVLACGNGALLAHASAAALQDLLRAGGILIHVLIPRTANLRRPGLHIHRSNALTPNDITEVDGIPCTSLPRTLLDLAATSPAHLLKSACNQAHINTDLDFRAIEELLARSRRHPGAARLRAALGIDDLGEDRTKTALERRFLRLCDRAGVPKPAVNQWMWIQGEEMQCDFVWNAERLVVELDGWETHRTRDAFENDRRRDQLLQAHGWRVVRFTWRDIADGPHQAETTLLALLSDARSTASHLTR